MNQPRNPEHTINNESQWLKTVGRYNIKNNLRLKTPKTAARLA